PSDDAHNGGHPVALPQVRITRSEDATWVSPPAAAATTGDVANEALNFSQFPLVKLPKSLSDQLAAFAQQIWITHSRCVGILLLLDPCARSWSFAVPRQRAGANASCWSGLRADALGAEDHHLLAGSFQSRTLEPGEDPADAPPPHDGIHLVYAPSPQPQRIYTFLRSEGKTLLVPAQDLLFDDLQAALREYLPRLGLGRSQSSFTARDPDP